MDSSPPSVPGTHGSGDDFSGARGGEPPSATYVPTRAHPALTLNFAVTKEPASCPASGLAVKLSALQALDAFAATRQ